MDRDYESCRNGFAAGTPLRVRPQSSSTCNRVTQVNDINDKKVGSSDTPAEKITTDRNQIVSDLRELADLLAKCNMRLAYENWCWSTHAPTWKDVWEIVKAVDRPNIGLCLDTFQTAGSEWGDPRTISGRIDDMDVDELNRRFAASMDELARSIPPEKIYLLQISDAYKPTRPIEDKVINGLRPRGRWSHDFRPMPYPLSADW